MEALFLLIPLSLCLVALAIWLFFGAADSGQFDDLEGPAQHVLQDDDRAGAPAGDVIGGAGTGADHRTGPGAERGRGAAGQNTWHARR